MKRLVVIGLVGLLVGCVEEEPEQEPLDYFQPVGDEFYFFERSRPVPTSFSDDGDLIVLDAMMRGNTLLVDVQYPGGDCGEHNFALVWPGEWDPVELDVHHDSASDNCSEDEFETLLFNLQFLKEVYLDTYGESERAIYMSFPEAGVEMLYEWGLSTYVEMRQELIEHVWGTTTLPTDSEPVLIELDQTDSDFSELASLATLDYVDFEADYGFTSHTLHFHPIEPNNEVVIYHQGHNGGVILGRNTISFLLDRGYAVLGMAMPLTWPNQTGFVTLPSGEEFELIYHHDLQVLEDAGMPTMPLFLSPIVHAVNYLENSFDYEAIHMVGLSGGGWSTTMVAALDPRIEHSYPVAGSLPFHMRVSERDIGDWEQFEERPIFSIAGYLELYVMGSLGEGRSQLQVLNANDSCCFAVAGREDLVSEYEAAVNDELHNGVYGEFSTHIDYSHSSHMISNEALDVIAEDLAAR